MTSSLSVTVKGLIALALVALISIASNIVAYTQSMTTIAAVENNGALQSAIREASSLEIALADQVAAMKNFLLTGDRSWVERLEAGTGEVETGFAAVAGGLDRVAPDQKPKLDEAAELWRVWLDSYTARQISLMRDPMTVDLARAMELTGDSVRTIESVVASLSGIRSALGADQARIAAEQRADLAQVQTISLFGGIGVALFAVFLGLMTHLLVSVPLKRLVAAAKRLADGDLDSEIYGTGRGDEIGQMADAVGVFKENAIARRALEADQDAQKTRAEEDKKAAMASLAADFEQTVGSIVDTVSGTAAELQNAAQLMAATSQETSRQSTNVASASEQASSNVQTVASATEELASSVEEVGRQVTQSAEMSDQAVVQSRGTIEKVSALSQAADKIGNIVGIIQDIAEQTNLLALNATIEAARAGEAGRGFAVVASEVKTLAEQTTKATTEIASQIGAIQSTTVESAEAIETISGSIGDLNTIATAIASAVEEQSSATQEIARNVHQAATGTGEVSGSIAEVQNAATEASAASGKVLASADGLAEQADLLKAEMARFLETVRAA
ncbi:MAG: methyl-accepting chemotaxis protein [Pseudomonadota bacterium]